MPASSIDPSCRTGEGVMPAACPTDGDCSAPNAAMRVDPLLSEQARILLKALADPVRQQVIEALGDGERCVCDLTAQLDLAQSRLSFHLRVMREAGLISGRQQGRWMYYRLEPLALCQLRDWLVALQARSQRPASDCD